MAPDAVTFVGLSLDKSQLLHHNKLNGMRHVIVSQLAGGVYVEFMWAPEPFGGSSTYACILKLQGFLGEDCRVMVALVCSQHHRLIGMASSLDLATSTTSVDAARSPGPPLQLSWSPSGASLAVKCASVTYIINSPFQWFRWMTKMKDWDACLRQGPGSWE